MANNENGLKRLHHSAAVVKDLSATRAFYTQIVGLPHTATWCEELEGGESYCHAFFSLEDGGALAFFQFANDALYEANKRPENLSPFQHVAFSASESCQQAIEDRAKAHNVPTQTIDHGYCSSLYLTDPDGHMVEVTVDNKGALATLNERAQTAEADLERWLSGDYFVNNEIRGDHA